MNIQELQCPVCKEEYSQANPPRLLTMCGHTFCHKCIKSLITKRKDKGFRVKCPIDKIVMQMDKPNANLFPKNIALINLIHKTKCQFGSNEFLSISMIQKNTSNIEKDCIGSGILPSNSEILPENGKEQTTTKQQNKNCRQHHKILDVYCLKDCQLICTDCALFSNHKSHQVMSLNELINLENKKKKQIRQIVQNKQRISKKFNNKQIQTQIYDLVDNKKLMIKKQSEEYFMKIRTMLQRKQKELNDKLEIQILRLGQRIKDKMKINQQTMLKYNNWQNENKQITEQQKNIQNVELNEKLSNFIESKFYDDKIKEGKQIIKQIQKQQQHFIQNLQSQINSISFISKQHQIQSLITLTDIQIINIINKNYEINKSQIQTDLHHDDNFFIKKQYPLKYSNDLNIQHQFIHSNQHNQFSNLNSKDQFKCQSQNDQQSLLDFDTHFEPKPLTKSTFSCNNISVLSVHSTQNIKPKNTPNTTIKKRSYIKQNNIPSNTLKTRNRSNTSLSGLSVRSSNISEKGSLMKPKKKQSQFKYQNLINDIKLHKIDTIDLTGTQPKPNQLTQILEAVHQSGNIKTIKLMRNKLDDDFIDKNLKYLVSVQRINLAQNKFTQQGVDLILYILKANKNHKIKYINMGQNRITQRKNRKVLQDFKKLSVDLIL